MRCLVWRHCPVSIPSQRAQPSRRNLAAPHSVRTFAEHGYCVYSAAWNPAAADVFATASGDCTVKLWDCRAPYSSATLPAHGYEVLAVDWCKYNDAVLATGSVDKTIRLWDVRAPGMPLATLGGHGYAVRRVKWSPWSGRLLFSCSYDMTVAAWDCGPALGGAALAQPLPPGLAAGETAPPQMDGAAQMLRRWDHHTEFAVGLDASPLVDGLLASCGWDETACVWHCGSDPRQPM
jgi:peroxin-7